MCERQCFTTRIPNLLSSTPTIMEGIFDMHIPGEPILNRLIPSPEATEDNIQPGQALEDT